MSPSQPNPTRDATRNTTSNAINRRGVVYLLALIILLQFGYPITFDAFDAELSRRWLTVGFQLLYAGLCAAGIYVTSYSRRYLPLTVGSALLFLTFGFLFARTPADPTWQLLTYASLILFYGSVTWVLLHYIFAMPRVTRDVLYAAVAVYLLLGATFVSIFGVVETLQPGSFIDNAAPVERAFLPWQTLVYYSYATLTTLGYGDVLPISGWARSLATLEAVIGVLYLAILMARLVGLYAQDFGTMLDANEKQKES